MSVNPIRLARRWAVAVGVVALAAGLATPSAVASPPGAAILYEGHPNAVPGSYVVKLAGVTTPTAAAAADLATRYGGRIHHTYDHALHGFAIHTSTQQARRLAADPRVAYVAQDLTISVDGDAAPASATGPAEVAPNLFVQPNPPSWGLDRVDQRALPLDGRYAYPSTASAARAYIIGTGIRYTHREFTGRAVFGYDAVGGVTPPGQDCHGHSTHIAGTVGGVTVGLAKSVQLVSVRVLNCSGSGTVSGLLTGVDWVARDNRANPKPSVAVFSLSGSYYQPLNDVVTNAIASNVHFSVPAGDSNANACNYSPGSAPRATTAGATNSADYRTAFSNYGSCVDLFAPGDRIYSAWATGDADYAHMSGTATAAAHAGGVAALWRHRFPADTADQVAGALVANATSGAVRNPGLGSPNRLLYMGMIPM